MNNIVNNNVKSRQSHGHVTFYVPVAWHRHTRRS